MRCGGRGLERLLACIDALQHPALWPAPPGSLPHAAGAARTGPRVLVIGATAHRDALDPEVPGPARPGCLLHSLPSPLFSSSPLLHGLQSLPAGSEPACMLVASRLRARGLRE